MLRSVSNIISSSVELFARDFKKFLPLVIIILLPQPILTVLGLSGIYLNQVTLIFNSLTNIIILVSIPVLLIIYGWAILAITKLSFSSYHNQSLTWSEALQSTVKRLLPSFFTLALVHSGRYVALSPSHQKDTGKDRQKSRRRSDYWRCDRLDHREKTDGETRNRRSRHR